MGLISKIAQAANDAKDATTEEINDVIEAVTNTSSDVTDTVEDVTSNAGNAVRTTGRHVRDTIVSGVGDTTAHIRGRADVAGSLGRKAVDEALKDLKGFAEKAGVLIDNTPGLALGSVNGTKFYTPVDGAFLLEVAIARKDPNIEMVIQEPNVREAYESLAASTSEEFKSQLRSRFPVLNPSPNLAVSGIFGPDDAAAILAIAACISAAGVAVAAVTMSFGVMIFIILVGVLLIYAIHEGYNIENVSLTTTNGLPSLTFRIVRNG